MSTHFISTDPDGNRLLIESTEAGSVRVSVDQLNWDPSTDSGPPRESMELPAEKANILALAILNAVGIPGAVETLNESTGERTTIGSCK